MARRPDALDQEAGRVRGFSPQVPESGMSGRELIQNRQRWSGETVCRRLARARRQERTIFNNSSE